MKYVKAHKETLRPFKKEGGCVRCRKPGKYTASANMENTQKPCRYALATTSENETKEMPQWGKKDGFIYHRVEGIAITNSRKIVEDEQRELLAIYIYIMKKGWA